MRIAVDLVGSIRDADTFHQLKRAGTRLFFPCAVGRHDLGDLETHSVDWIEVAQRVLKDHRNATPVQIPALVVCHLQQVLAVKQQFARHDLARGAVDQVHDGRSGHRFTRSGFAQNGQRFAAIQMPADIAHRMNRALCRMEIDRQVADF